MGEGDMEDIKSEKMERDKVKIPNFQMKRDIEAYFEWEMKVEQMFACHKYSEVPRMYY